MEDSLEVIGEGLGSIFKGCKFLWCNLNITK